jgi:secreted PhoX family phosphatase
MRVSLLSAAVGVAVFGNVQAAEDIGLKFEHQLQAKSVKLFGFVQPLKSSADAGDVVPRNLAAASERQLLAKGLKAEYVTRAVGGNGDMITFWPDDIHYTHLIVCNELGRDGVTPGGNDGYTPAVQRVDVKTGEVETILHGMDRCDGLRTTQWGTVLVTEEAGDDGGAYEIIEPLSTTGHWIADRGAAGMPADIRDGVDSAQVSDKVVKRTALVAQSWEGLDVLDNGVVIGGDELRPSLDTDGGAIFRFVPSELYNCQGAPVRPGQLCDNTISDLADSPLAAGTNYALATVCNGTDDFGQGCESGNGLWVAITDPGNARAEAAEAGATGYCRPEDLHVDGSYGEFVGGEGIRWCWNNTCAGGGGEALCVTETDLDAQTASFNADFGRNLLDASATVTRFVENDAEMRNHDNLDIQPHTSNVYVIEDYNEIDSGGTGGDVWACLPDGGDRDTKTDGCVRVLSITDPEAEPSGFIFDGTGKVAYYHVQHGEQYDELRDFESNPVDGRTDDLIRITGFKLPKGSYKGARYNKYRD